MAMHSRSIAHAASALFLAASLAGCVGYPGETGGYGPPGAYGTGGAYGAQTVVGSVQGFDPRSGRLSLASEGAYGGTVDVWLDRSTRLYYRGQQQDPSGLERGDRVRVEVQDSGGRASARTVEVLQDVRESGGYGGNYGNNAGPYAGSGLEGDVRRVDTRRRIIEISRGGYNAPVEQVMYDERTRFDYRGQRVTPEQLEPGDAVRVDARRSGSGWYADTVWVTANARER